MSPQPPSPERRFYGRRHGRKLRATRSRALDETLPQYSISLEDARNLPGTTWLEIGFGNGEHLLTQALAHPDIFMIGCEPFMNGVSMLVRDIERQSIKNIRIWPDDARLLMDALPDNSLDRCYLIHPDPWPKTRHHKRRFIQEATLDRLAALMTDNAELLIATDDVDLGEWMLWHCWKHPDFQWLARQKKDWAERPPGWPLTRYEEKTRAEGKSPIYLKFRRKSRKA